MRRFAANYLISDAGKFLKNGIAVVNDDYFVTEYIDTKGLLRESEQLFFENGILMAGIQFRKIGTVIPNFEPDLTFRTIVFKAVAITTRFSIHDIIDLGKQLQVQFPEMKIPEILNEIILTLQTEGGFIKEQKPGIYLLTGTDLAGLHFTSRSKLKKCLSS